MKLASFIYQDIRSFGIVKAEGMIDLGRRLGDRYGDQQQVTDTAGRAARCIEQGREKDHIDQRQAEQLHQVLGFLHQYGDEDVEDQVNPAAGAKQLDMHDIQQLLVEVAGDQ